MRLRSDRLPNPAPAAVSAALQRPIRLLLVLLAVFLGGCISEEQEQELGNAIAADINQQIPLVQDPFLNIYLNRIGQRIADVSERPHVPYQFYIINTASVNAFALPGGHIYLTRGLIERTENFSQLAGVLAHEVGHVAARHGAQALERELRTGSLISLMYELFLRRQPEILQHQSLQIGGRLWFASHSRAAEREADRLAVRYMLRSGVDPDGMISMLESLLDEEVEETRASVDWFSTHPVTANRIKLLRRKITQLESELPPDLVEDIASYSFFLRRVQMLPVPILAH